MNIFTACFSKIAGVFPTFTKAGSDVIMQKSVCDVKSTKYECGRNSSGWPYWQVVPGYDGSREK